MKKIILLLLITFSNPLLSQEINEYIQKGIEYHDAKNYNNAIKIYKKALKIDNESTLAHYEIALSYNAMQDYKNAIKHSDIVLKHNKDYLIPAYLIKGSSLDIMGETKESINVFRKAIKEHGNNYLLYYNLALNYYKIKEYNDAEKNAINAILTNSNHTSSHLLLGNINYLKKQKVQTLLPLYYFLFLEPDSNRSNEAYGLLIANLKSGVAKDSEKPNNINITLNVDSKNDDEFGAAELMISLLEANKYSEKEKEKTEEEIFEENTTSFFTVLGELKKDSNKGIYWELYTSFFYELSQSDHIEAYCHYIRQVNNQKSVEWLLNNDKKLEEFDLWLQEN